jgi:hypothetical protein
MCHQANEDLAWSCQRCGYEFGQSPDKVIELLRGQRRTLRIGLTVIVAAELALIAVFAFYPYLFGRVWVPAIIFIAPTIWVIRILNRLVMTRQSLRSLEAQVVSLPKATLKSR